MRASLLLEREPFAQIAERTIARFLREQFGQTFEVHWVDRDHSSPNFSGARPQLWLLNSYLNLFFRHDTPRKALEPIIQEFTHSKVAWRKPLQRLYVTLALHSLTSQWLAHARLAIIPDIPDARSWVIVPGNNRIRFLNHVQQRCFAVLKDRFPVRSLTREIDAQSLAAEFDVPVPKLLERAGDDSWFCEQYICGTPTNRIANMATANHYVQTAARHLLRMADATRSEVATDRYVGAIEQQVNSLVSRWSIANEMLRTEVSDTVQRLAERICTHNGSETIETCQCHGDFQDANILVDGTLLYLIDWEFTARRQFSYDFLVYDLRLRFPQQLDQRLRQFVSQGPAIDSLLAEVSNGPRTLLHSAAARRSMIDLLLLEELTLRLEQSVDRPLLQVPAGLGEISQLAAQWVK